VADGKGRRRRGATRVPTYLAEGGGASVVVAIDRARASRGAGRARPLVPVALLGDLVKVPASVARVGADDALAHKVPLVHGVGDVVAEAAERRGVDRSVVVVDFVDVRHVREGREAPHGVRGEDHLLREALVRVVAA